MSIRYPLDALAEACGCSLASLGRVLGLSGSVWKEYRDQGVTAHVADRLAAKAGFHPAVVWPSWYDDETAALSVECADDRCDEAFVPVRSTQRYCSEGCRQRAKKRRQRRERYWSDPEFRARVLAQNEAYRRENLRGIAAQKRAYRRRVRDASERVAS